MYPEPSTRDHNYGYCKCGCGLKTRIATRTSSSRKWVKGEPIEYVFGHKPKKKITENIKLRADLTGQTFGKLTAVRFSHMNSHKKSCWECICACGAVFTTVASRLKSGATKSCGCANIEKLTKHGRHKTRTYRIWTNMKQRCSNPKNKDYTNYGARGITVCQKWEFFENFLSDMGEAPKDLEIDRIDNDKGYSADNCEWTTHKHNCSHRRNGRKKDK